MRTAQPLTEDQFCELIETSAIENVLDLGVTNIMTVQREGQEFFLISTTNGTFAELH